MCTSCIYQLVPLMKEQIVSSLLKKSHNILQEDNRCIQHTSACFFCLLGELPSSPLQGDKATRYDPRLPCDCGSLKEATLQVFEIVRVYSLELKPANPLF